jgi:hypothetical protein
LPLPCYEPDPEENHHQLTCLSILQLFEWIISAIGNAGLADAKRSPFSILEPR